MESIISVVACCSCTSQAQPQPFVSPFPGSEALGSCEAEFRRLMVGEPVLRLES